MTVIDKAEKIKLLILDVDGVLTNGGLQLDDQGQQTKTFNVKDGLGMKLLQQSGVEIAIITSKTSDVVTHRMKELGVKHVYQGQKNKTQAYSTLKKQLTLQDDQIAYIGDDLPDIIVMAQCGFPIAVNDASAAVKEFAAWVTTRNGGQGAVREACEFIMQAQETWEAALQPFLPTASLKAND